MNKTQEIGYSFLQALGTLAYVLLVTFIMNRGDQWFTESNAIWTGAAILLLLVVSATITGLLVLGRPIYLYLETKKIKLAIKSLSMTLAWLLAIIVIILIIFAI